MEQNGWGGSWLSALGRWIALVFVGGSLHRTVKSGGSGSNDQEQMESHIVKQLALRRASRKWQVQTLGKGHGKRSSLHVLRKRWLFGSLGGHNIGG